MGQSGRQRVLGLLAEARARRVSIQAAMARAWERVSAEQRRTARNHAVAVATVAVATVLTLSLAPRTVGPLVFADLVIAAAAWFGGLSVGVVAALAAVLAAPRGGSAHGGGGGILARLPPVHQGIDCCRGLCCAIGESACGQTPIVGNRAADPADPDGRTQPEQ